MMFHSARSMDSVTVTEEATSSWQPPVEDGKTEVGNKQRTEGTLCNYFQIPGNFVNFYRKRIFVCMFSF